MNKSDSAKIQFYRVQMHAWGDCSCNQIIAQLTVDFGSLLPEIEADTILSGYVKAPIDRWILGSRIAWDSRRLWAGVRRSTTTQANQIMREWIVWARAHILGMTGREMLAALEGYKSIEVPR